MTNHEEPSVIPPSLTRSIQEDPIEILVSEYRAGVITHEEYIQRYSVHVDVAVERINDSILFNGDSEG